MATYSFPDVYVERQKTVNTTLAQSGAYIGGFIGKAIRGVRNKPVLITSWNEYIETFANGIDNPFTVDGEIQSYLPYAVYGFFQNGGTECYVLNAMKTGVKASGTVGGLKFEALDEGAWGNALYVGVAASTSVTAAFDISIYLGDSANTDTLVEVFKGITLSNVLNSINSVSEFVTVSIPESAQIAAAAATALTGGEITDFASGATLDGVLSYFDAIDDISMLSFVDSGTLADNTKLLAYCDTRADIHAILNNQSETVAPDAVASDVPASGRGNLYYPWIGVIDPISGVTTNIPNCGHVQGMIVRMTENYGLEKVPAGTNATIIGAVSLATELGKTDAGNLNDKNICCLISKPNYGIVCWGGRSLFEDGRYITSVLLENRITRDLYTGLQPFVFESNISSTWRKVKATVEQYLRALWEDGVLDGSTESEAYSVVCDETVNTDKTIAKKQLNATVAYREKDCAEFIIIKLSHTMQ